MTNRWFIILSILLILILYIFPYALTKGFKRSKFGSLLPSVLSLLMLSIVILKFAFISNEFQRISDIVFIMMLSLVTLILLSVGIIQFLFKNFNLRK